MDRSRRVLAAVLVLGGVLLASCSSSTGSPHSSSASGASPSASSSATSAPTDDPSTPTATPNTQAAEAEAERAVETAWANYWRTFLSINSHPPAAWPKLVALVAVNPIYGQVLVQASKNRVEGLTGYGAMQARPYWPSPVAGRTKVVMGDCQNSAHAGLKFVKSGKPHTVGEPRVNIHATLVKGPSGWRVQQINYLGTPC